MSVVLTIDCKMFAFFPVDFGAKERLDAVYVVIGRFVS